MLTGYRRLDRRRVLRVALLSPLLLLASGCESAGPTRDGSMRASEAVQFPMLMGVPLPRGFEVVPERSVARESGRFRVARYEFVGSATRNALHEFFLNHMPGAGFKLMQRRDEGGVYDLRFESGTEECAIRIGEKSFNQAYFIVDVGPLPSGPAPAMEDPTAPSARDSRGAPGRRSGS